MLKCFYLTLVGLVGLEPNLAKTMPGDSATKVASLHVVADQFHQSFLEYLYYPGII